MQTFNKETVLKKINLYRRSHRSPPVQWSDTIATNAQNWAKHIAENGSLQHTPGGKYGENLAMEFNPTRINVSDRTREVVSSIKRWYNEVNEYDFSVPGFSSKTGHFSQLIWKDSTEIGVGVALDKEKKVYVVMQFSPPGNVCNDDVFKNNVLCKLGL